MAAVSGQRPANQQRRRSQNCALIRASTISMLMLPAAEVKAWLANQPFKNPVGGVKVSRTRPTWRAHVDAICNKVSVGLGVLKCIRCLVPRQTLLRMYEALVTLYFDYCSEVWGCMGKGLCNRLQRLQNRAGRIITFSDYNTVIAEILELRNAHDLQQSQGSRGARQ